MVLKIDGTDIVPYIAYGGVKWQRSDVDGEGAGRMLDGTLAVSYTHLCSASSW